MQEHDAIQVRDLRFGFGAAFRIDGLSFTVGRGEIFGFLGHNGAGKTTTVRLLNGILNPEAGEVRVLGLSPVTDGPRVRARTGVLTETPALDDRLTARETLRFFADLFGVDRARVDDRVDELLASFELSERADEPVGRFSKGMRQRLALARTLINDPEILFLDEPTSGLDPVATRKLHFIIEQLSAAGRSVFLCTHNLAEAEQLCDRIAVLEQGRLRAMGTGEELARHVERKPRLELELAPDDVQRAFETLRAAGVAEVERDGEAVLVVTATREQIPELLFKLTGANVHVFRVEPRRAALEDVYFALQEGNR